jgi:hypothetical protein
MNPLQYLFLVLIVSTATPQPGRTQTTRTQSGLINRSIVRQDSAFFFDNEENIIEITESKRHFTR